jgi:enamine deaminase RidA (YjgF/YER057c/UK114 family)
MDNSQIARVRGLYIGRNRSSAYKDLVFTVATAEDTSTDITSQTKQALSRIENNLNELGSHKHKLLSVQVYMANILDKPKMDAVWCQWIGSDPQHWPQRACLGVALEGNVLIEVTVTAMREA